MSAVTSVDLFLLDAAISFAFGTRKQAQEMLDKEDRDFGACFRQRHFTHTEKTRSAKDGS